MKKLLITLMLISPFSFADWGDVYYCQMTTHSGLTVEGKRKDYILDKFQFKLDKTKKAMVFGSSSYFTDILAGLTKEYWSAVALNSSYTFREGEFQSINTSDVTTGVLKPWVGA